MKKIGLLLFCIFCFSGCTATVESETAVTPVPTAVSTPPLPTYEPDIAGQPITTPAPTEEPFSKSPENFYKENGDIRFQLYLIQADVTHDGIDDYIETCMYFPSETDFTEDFSQAIQNRIGVAGAIVQVYDGRDTSPDDLVSPIWSKEYSACHAGNGQVSLVYRDGEAYLLEGCLWQGQGFTGYGHSVISFGETGLQYTKEEYSLQFYETDYSRDEQIALVLDFKQQLEPWLEGAKLIVATDVSLNEQLISTQTKEYVPADYYDTVWKQWTN